MKRSLVVLSILLGLLLPAQAAFADKDIDEGYARTTFRELVQTLVVMGGFDISDPNVADEYIFFTYPRLYKNNFNNDVAWNAIRNRIVARIQEKREYYRILYETTNVFRLDRYDFEDQSFPISSNTDTKDVGFVALFTREEFRSDARNERVRPLFPTDVVMKIERPFTVDKLSVPMDKVEKILARIEETGSKDRIIYGRTRVRITESMGFVRTQDHALRSGLKGEVVSIDFFIDKEMTKWIGSAPVPK